MKCGIKKVLLNKEKGKRGPYLYVLSKAFNFLSILRSIFQFGPNLNYFERLVKLKKRVMDDVMS